MKKLFLQSGKLMIGEFPEEPKFDPNVHFTAFVNAWKGYNAAVESVKASAVEVVNPEAILTWDDQVWFFEHIAMAKDKPYNLPSGWTVEYGYQYKPEDKWIDCGKTTYDHIESQITNKPIGDTTVTRKIARLIPTSDLSGDPSKWSSTGIVATGIAEAEQINEERVCISQFASDQEFHEATIEAKAINAAVEYEKKVHPSKRALMSAGYADGYRDALLAVPPPSQAESQGIAKMRMILRRARKFVSEGADMLADTNAVKIKAEFEQCVKDIDEALTRKTKP